MATTRFVRRTARLEGRRVEYLLHDQAVRFLNGTLRLRQVTRLTEATGHQTAVVTSRWDLRDIVVASRMFERWRQENFFKYMREEYLIDALTDYEVEPDDPQRSVPNPARKAVDKELRKARADAAGLRERYGSTALEYLEGRTATRRAFTDAAQRIQSELRKATDRVATLVARQKALPARMPLSETPNAADAVKLSAERKHLTNVLKMVAYQESMQVFRNVGLAGNRTRPARVGHLPAGFRVAAMGSDEGHVGRVGAGGSAREGQRGDGAEAASSRR